MRIIEISYFFAHDKMSSHSERTRSLFKKNAGTITTKSVDRNILSGNVFNSLYNVANHQTLHLVIRAGHISISNTRKWVVWIFTIAMFLSLLIGKTPEGSYFLSAIYRMILYLSGIFSSFIKSTASFTWLGWRKTAME